MTEEFKKEALKMLRESHPLLNDDELLKIAKILWDLMPIVYNKEAS